MVSGTCQYTTYNYMLPIISACSVYLVGCTFVMFCKLMDCVYMYVLAILLCVRACVCACVRACARARGCVRACGRAGVRNCVRACLMSVMLMDVFAHNVCNLVKVTIVTNIKFVMYT